MTSIWQDVKYAVRTLSRRRAFSVVALFTIALGIGANTAIFSVVKTVVLSPLPYGRPNDLVMLWGKIERGAVTNLSGPEVRDYAAESRTFADVAAYTSTAAILSGEAEPERVVAAAVTPNLFVTLRTAALVGRTYAASDDPVDVSDQVVLSHSLWERRFGGSRDVVGRRILIDGASMLVIGVMPAAFRLPLDFVDDRPSELWRPLDLRTSEWASWGNHSLIGVARLGHDVSPVVATLTMRRLEDRWIQDNVGGGWNNREVVRRAAVPIKDLVVGDVSRALWTLFGAVAAILIIACANVANLTLARSDERQSEIAVRTAIGASRAQIVRQLLIESVLLSTTGGALAVCIAYAAMRVLLFFDPQGIPRINQVSLDTGVLVFTLLVSIATGVIFGSAPVVELWRRNVTPSLKDTGWTGSIGRRSQRFRDALVVTQLAFSVVLLIGALLLLRSFIELRRVDLGFNPRSALTVRLTLPATSYAKDADAIRVMRTIRLQLAALPGVQSVGATRLLPLTGTIGNWSITQEDRVKGPGENPNGDWQVVTPGYFEAMGIRVARGRTFTDGDDQNAPIVAVISEAMAGRYWPREDAMGKRFRIGRADSPWISIVGIVGEVHHNALTERPRAEMYVPQAQWGAAGASTRRAMTFVIRTANDPLDALPRVREAVRLIDPTLPLSEVRTLDGIAGDAVSQARFTAALLGLFAGLALALAALGIYGLISLLMTRRRRELGIRMALGARSSEIMTLVLARGMTLVVVGAGVGVAAAAALTRLLSSLLYGVSPFDLATYLVVPAILACTSLVACAIPAYRAAGLNPVSALRQE